MVAFITASPFVYVEYFHVSPRTYAWLFGLNIAGVIVVTFINARVVTRVGPLKMLASGAMIAGLAGCALAFTGYTGLGGLPAIVAAVIVFVSVTGMLGANSVASLMGMFPGQACAAAALTVSGQFAVDAGFSAVVSTWANGTPMPMCLGMAVAGVGSLVAFLLVKASQSGVAAQPSAS